MPDPEPASSARHCQVEMRCEVLEERVLLATRLWTGAAGDGFASSAGNWQGNVAPVAGDSLVFQAGTPAPCIIDANAPASFANLTVEVGYTGGVFVSRDLTITNQLSASGGFVNVLPGVTLSAKDVTLSLGARINGVGTLTLSGSTELTNNASLQDLHVRLNGKATVANATLDAVRLSVNGTLVFTTGASVVRARIDVNGPGQVDFTDEITIEATEINNVGAARWLDGKILLEDSSVINNFGSFTINCHKVIVGEDGTFNNYGRLEKNLAGNSTIFRVKFNNRNLGMPLLPAAEVEVRAGGIHFLRDGQSNAPFVVNANAHINFEGGTTTLETGADFKGTGTVTITNNATVRLATQGKNISNNPPPLTVINATCTVVLGRDRARVGTLSGPGIFNSLHEFDWHGGEIKGLTVIAQRDFKIAGTAEQSAEDSSILLDGTTSWEGGCNIKMLRSVITNLGIFEIANENSIVPDPADKNTSRLVNAKGGKIAKVLTPAGPQAVPTKIMVNFENAGKIELNGRKIVDKMGNPISRTPGSIDLGGGTIAVAGIFTLPADTNLTGGGTVDGALVVEGGTINSLVTDTITVTGTADLDGSLNVTVPSGFSPSLGNTFSILAFTSAEGSFSTITGLDYDPASGKRFAIHYNATDVTLEVVSLTTLTTPAVSSLSTGSGTTEGGTSVTLTGTNFDEVSSVMFGDEPALSFTRNSSTQIVAIAPSQAAATVDVRVTNLAGTSANTSADDFAYSNASAPAVSSLNVSTVYTYGGAPVVITGTNLRGTTGVDFGSVPALAFEVLSATQVRAWAPAQAAGTIDIEVTTHAGSSANVSADNLTYATAPAPTVTSLGTTSGSSAGGASVTITGTNFTDVTGVYFGDAAADYTVSSSTSITAIAPANVAGIFDVRVSTLGGVSAPGSSARFTYQAAPPPQITSLGTSSGTTSGGTLVTINGSNFGGTYEVLFGDEAAADFIIASPTVIHAIAPAHASGAVTVSVVTPTGNSQTVSGALYTYNNASAPTVTSLSLSSGSTAGGDVVTITGTNLGGTTEVLFGTTPADFTVLSDTTVFAVVPAHASGSGNVTVTTWSGQTSPASFTYSAATAPAVAALSASSGPSTGGNIVVINGSDFSGATGVTFGSVDAGWFTVLSGSSILTRAPAHAAGQVDVQVSTFAGSSSNVSADNYTYSSVSVPTVTAVSPGSGGGSGGTVLTLTGTGFTGTQDVRVGGVSADFVINSDTQITAVAPPHAPGDWDVVVLDAAGPSALSSSARFTYSAASAATITSLSQSGGYATGGAAITITGTNFLGAQEVRFGDVPASFTVNSDTEIVAITPASAPGAAVVSVLTPAGSSTPGAGSAFTYGSATPGISSLSATSGSTAGGDTVYLTGSNFTGATAVRFGSTLATSFGVVSGTQIVAVTPAHSSGSAAVTVTTSSGTSGGSSFSYSAASAPSISSLSFSSGSAAGGFDIQINGSNFTGATAVAFGSTAATSFTVLSDSIILATVPAKPSGTGTVDVRVTTYGGTSSIVSADQFTYNWVTASAPTVTGLSIGTGTAGGGTTVILTGTDFGAASAVKFGATNATSFTVLSNTTISAVSPSGTAGTINVTVTTPGGTSATATANQFTYVAAGLPTITGLSTGTSTTAGGVSVTITGTNFTGATSMKFGNVAASSFTVNSATQITATTPAQAAGTYSLSITTSAGTLTTAPGFTYTNAGAPTVSSLGTTTGSSTGGTSVSITGTNFTGATAVYFGDVAASFTVNSSTSITATSPSQAGSVVNVRVQTYSGTSATSTSARFTYTAASAPTVSSLGTSSGSTAGGTSVGITGTNFTGATAVYFGSVKAASFTVNSSTSITAISSSQAAGTVDVIVWTPSGSSTASSSDHFTYNAASAPAITGVSPSSGSTGGGATVTITGTDFTGATAVLFGTLSTSFIVDSATQITAIAPPQASGTIDIRVTTPSGTSSTVSADQYTYNAASAPSVSGVSSSSGSSAGGAQVTITGSNFTGASSVAFGSEDAWFFRVISDTILVATAPAQAAGTVDVRVTTPSGTSSVVSADQFTYNAVSAPTITGVSPVGGSGTGGSTVTITGTNLLGTTTVLFGDEQAAFSIVSSTTLTATLPAHQAGTVDVSVIASGLTSALSSSSRFTYTAPSAPSISSVSASSGSTAGGTKVTITGTNFTAAQGVLFGVVPAASFEVVSSTSIVAYSPAHAAGTIDVRVTTPGGVSAPVSGDQFTYSAASSPSISSISPSSGSSAAGTVVTITGSNFGGATAVTFGTTPASFAVNSSTRITAVVPTGPSGSVSVTVTTYGGTSSGTTFTYSSLSAPAVSGLSVSGGSTAGGTEVTVLGSGFLAATSVKFGTTEASDFTVLSDTALRARSPEGLSGQTDVTVTSAGGTSSTSSASHFTYSSPSAPTVSEVSPSSSVSTGGTTVITITGTNFTDVSEVRLGAIPASTFVVNSSTQITAVAPAQPAGTVNVRVTTGGGTSATASGNQLTYAGASAPSISSLSASYTPSTGGAGILISGSNFSGATSVLFDTTAASFTILTDGAIVATAPAHAAGSANVTVTTPSGTSSGVSFTWNTNQTPAGVNDSYSVVRDTTLTVAAPGVRTNDTDGNGDALFVAWYSNPSHGTLAILGDGSLVYRPTAGYVGSDSFTYKVSDGTAESGTATVTITVTSSLLAEGGPLSPATPAQSLTVEALRPILDAAISRWIAAGVSPDELARLNTVEVAVLDLPGATLGLANPNVLWIDANAAGYGWFIDPTPADDLEFLGSPNVAVAGRMDLLTVAAHELGHVFGLPDLDLAEHPHDLMAEALAAGIRRLPEPHRAFPAGQPFLAPATRGPVETPWHLEAALALAVERGGWSLPPAIIELPRTLLQGPVVGQASTGALPQQGLPAATALLVQKPPERIALRTLDHYFQVLGGPLDQTVLALPL